MGERHGTPVRVAVVGPFSGPRAAWGELLTRAVRARTGAGAIVWEAHDDLGDADRAALVAEAVVADGGYAAVIGHFNSMGAARALPHYRAAGLPLLLPLATMPGLLDGTRGALRWCPDDTGQVAAIHRAAAELGLGTPSVTHDGSAYGRALARRFEAWATPSGTGSGLPSGTPSSTPPDTSPDSSPDASPATVSHGEPGPAPDPASPPGGDPAPRATVVCGTHFGAAATARSLGERGLAGARFFTDDCAVEDFARLLGPEGAGDARVVALRGGPEAQVEAAFDCLVRALGEEPDARGERLLEVLRRHAWIAFTDHGDPVDAADAAGWEVVPVRDLVHRTARTPRPVATDVVVVGAGVVGAATAAALAEQGLSVALASPGPDAPSATAWSGGLVRAYDPDPELRALAVRSHRLLWGGDPRRAAACGFHRTGSLVLLGRADVDEARRGLAELRAQRIEAELLAPAEIRRRWPDLALGDEVAAGLFEPGGGYASPAATAAFHRTAAVRHGAMVLPYGPVRTLGPHPDGVEVGTAAGTVVAGQVVVAAGGGAPVLLGERLTARLGPAAPRTKRIRYAFFASGGREVPAVNDLTTGMWGRPERHGPLSGTHLTGRPVEEWDVPPTGGEVLDDAQVAHIREGAARRWPWIADAPFRGGRYGADLYHPDGPLLGHLPGDPPVVASVCWSGGGFKTAPGAAERTVELVRAALGR
ncbi:FAD-dependent oxidoreductase [Streptomyces fradiae]|uniref:FAD-dependent oxidoreductase n=1 Tax=Streptomyces fradiae TaxID=1906 RepID=UPI003401920D